MNRHAEFGILFWKHFKRLQNSWLSSEANVYNKRRFFCLTNENYDNEKWQYCVCFLVRISHEFLVHWMLSWMRKQFNHTNKKVFLFCFLFFPNFLWTSISRTSSILKFWNFLTRMENVYRYEIFFFSEKKHIHRENMRLFVKSNIKFN